MRPTTEQISAGLCEVFNQCHVEVSVTHMTATARVLVSEFKFEHIERLPAVFGTTRIDFENELTRHPGYSEYTPSWTQCVLLITARY